MSDRLILDNYLLILKSTVEVYIHGTLESSNSDVRSLLKNGLDETLKHQARTYDLMTDMGWYNVSNVKESVVCKTLNSLSSC